jgi:hypothetical protein
MWAEQSCSCTLGAHAFGIHQVAALAAAASACSVLVRDHSNHSWWLVAGGWWLVAGGWCTSLQWKVHD